MIFNSRKLRKALVSGLMGAAMSMAPVSAAAETNSIFGAAGNFFNVVSVRVLKGVKWTSISALLSKIGTMAAVKGGVLDVNTIDKLEEDVTANLEGDTKKFSHVVRNLTLVSPEDESNFMGLGIPMGAAISADCLLRFNEGAGARMYNAGMGQGRQEGYKEGFAAGLAAGAQRHMY